ncbi:unnamed protein product [Discula destructiva]
MTHWSTLRVIDLKAELSNRGLPTQDIKADLVKRLAVDDDAAPARESHQQSASAPQMSAGKEKHHSTAQIGQRYIPVGCLVSSSERLDKVLHHYQDLSKNEWICFETIASQDKSFGITRVYVLPDDTDNGRVDRSSPNLQQKKKELLATLDFSAATWNGAFNNNAPANFPVLSPAFRLAVAHDEDGASLLKMFNTIPSPKPNFDMVDDDFDRQCMSDLLEGAVDGLITTMYPYQCRSAALMHQKEVQPAQFLDPRLIEVLDQNGRLYYYNSVTGNVFLEPRYYDGVRGGILAEEMGAGKTLICLALIAATKDLPAYTPDIYQGSNNLTIRPRVGSLMDMAAAVATKYANPWRRRIDPCHTKMLRSLNDNPGWYYLPRPESRRPVRKPEQDHPPQKIYLSHATLVIVPANLLQQWLQEISKHTERLNVHVIGSQDSFLTLKETTLIEYDIIITSVEALEALWQEYRRPGSNGMWTFNCGLGRVRFKRCIVDEGHKLGNVKLSGIKTGILQALDTLQIDARWIATGTPAQGLFGTEEGGENNTTLAESTAQQERSDLERIGAIATQYLKARPWSNTVHDYGDTVADWKVYIMQSRHNSQSSGRTDCLRSTINSMIVRHHLSEVSSMLPTVDAKVVELEGSYQDKLSLNLLSMMIIFNAVQSQRTDEDYFFHPKNRKSLLELVNNLRQATFYGGAFFSNVEIRKAVQTAEAFIEKAAVDISEPDSRLLGAAIAHGKLATQNKLKDISKLYHEPPIFVKNFPHASWMENVEEESKICTWSIDWRIVSGLICTNWKIMVAAQKKLRPFLDSAQKEKRKLLYGTENLDHYLNSGSFSRDGKLDHQMYRARTDECSQDPSGVAESKNVPTLAGNTRLGNDHVSPRKRHSAPMPPANQALPTPRQTPEVTLEIPAPLADTQLVSTSSAKLSYLIDAIVMHQKDEQIIVFYDNDNIAWYLAGVLEMLSIHHLIYAKGLTAHRRAQYVSTFNNTEKFRVLLMDINQAAFGLDMRAASRVYFINPVLNPQVEAQAIGRVRRISQQKSVTVETLVLKDSLEQVIMERKMNMTQAEHRNCKTILDDRPIYDWILNAKIISLPDVEAEDGPAQMAQLKVPQYLFGLELGRERSNPDEDILLEEPSAPAKGKAFGGDGRNDGSNLGTKRLLFAGDEAGEASGSVSEAGLAPSVPRPVKKARFAMDQGRRSACREE